MSDRKVRIGIDVGGTFTHAVAIDAGTFTLIGKVKKPTTHRADIGVAKGIIQCLHALIDDCKISPDEVILIAHSTTQATNALLEGDVAAVGILGMGAGNSSAIANLQTNIKNIELAPHKFLKTYHEFIKSENVTKERVTAALKRLKEKGAEVFVAAEAFSVDDEKNEKVVLDAAAEMGMLCTATHQISQLHGLKIRTRTAVINSSMLPKMLETANMTEKAVKETGIKAPLMIMRSDGGIMDIEEMRRRPILTMLSGPAAGVAAALLYARISDGIFLEVGGTSTDISAIKNGKSQIKSAEIGGNRLFLHTLDVRTIGVAGGSVTEIINNKIANVGPRSAHIAGVSYVNYAPDADMHKFKLDDYYYYQKDNEYYLAVNAGNNNYAITPTCASTFSGFIKEGDYSYGNMDALIRAFELASKKLGIPARQISEEILEKGSEKLEGIVNSFMHDYKLDRNIINLMGGGGGAQAIVPYLGKKMGLPEHTVKDHEVISAIGVALALVRDTIERTVIDPDESDIMKIREEAFASVQKMGAHPDTIEVFVEIEAKKNLVRATAQGSTEMKEKELTTKAPDEEEIKNIISSSIGCKPEGVSLAAQSSSLSAYVAEVHKKKFFGAFTEKNTAVRVVDKEGVIRHANNKAKVCQSAVGSAERDLVNFAEHFTIYNDAGAIIPKIFIIIGSRIVDFSGLIDMHQILPLMQVELRKFRESEPVAIVLNL